MADECAEGDVYFYIFSDLWFLACLLMIDSEVVDW